MNAIVANQVERYVGAIIDQTSTAHEQGKTHGQSWPQGKVPMPDALDDMAVRCNVNGVFDLLGHNADVVQAFRAQVGSAHHANAVAAPVYVPGDPHSTAPCFCVFVKQFNVAMLNQVITSVKLRLFESWSPVVLGGRLNLRGVGDVAKACGWTG